MDPLFDLDGPSESEDDVSLTSTIETEIDSQEEFTIEKILAERNFNDGKEILCLVFWEGYPMTDSTWEPRKNLPEIPLAEWDESKKTPDHQNTESHNIKEWEVASLENFEAQERRYEARNRRRRRLGLPETILDMSFDEFRDHILSYNLEGELVEKPGHPVLDNDTTRVADGGGQTATINVEVVHPSIRNVHISPKELSRNQTTDATSQKPTTIHSNTIRKSKPSRSMFISRKKNVPRNIRHAPRRPRPVPHDETVNVFAGGKKPRQKSHSLAQTMTAPVIPLTNRHHTTLSGMRPQGEHQEGINRLSNALLGADVKSIENNRTATSTQSRQDNDARRAHEECIGQTKEVKSTAPRPKVHWDNTEMNIDEEQSLFVPSDTPQRILGPEEETKPALSMLRANTSYNVDNVTIVDNCASGLNTEGSQNPHKVEKACRFGTNTSESINLTFSRIPLVSEHEWLSSFHQAGYIIFTHSCTERDFVSQYSSQISQLQLCEGLIFSNSMPGKLRTLATRLRLNAQNAISFQQTYCVFICPVKHQDLEKNRYSGQWTEATPTLKYLVFSLSDSLRPLTITGKSTSIASHALQKRQSLLSMVFSPGNKTLYQNLIPSGLRKISNHPFFLAFPKAFNDEATLISQWLRSVNADCDIKTAMDSGQWLTFMRNGCGAFILHEEALWAIRHFRDLNVLLQSRQEKLSFWKFTRSLGLEPTRTPQDHIASVGENVGLTEIFPQRIVIFVTPSFFVSQPKQAYQFFKWFFKFYYRESITHSRGKIALCADADEWLLSLAAQVARKSSSIQSAEHIERLALQNEPLETRLKTWKLLTGLIRECSDSVSEEEWPIVSAPPSIDGNDEQSLVNWFGWWTTSNLHRFRKFCVLGSSSKQIAERMTRPLKAPTFKQSCSNDQSNDSRADGNGHLKTIFHPPQACSTIQDSVKCTNRLYQWSQEPESKMNEGTVEYVFRPTLQWYGEQLEEGRGFEHISVTSWEPLFERFRIEDPKKDSNTDRPVSRE